MSAVRLSWRAGTVVGLCGASSPVASGLGPSGGRSGLAPKEFCENHRQQAAGGERFIRPGAVSVTAPVVTVEDCEERGRLGLQSAGKLDQGSQAWVATPVLDVDDSTEAHATSAGELLKSEPTSLTQPTHMHAEGVELRVRRIKARHELDLTSAPI